MEIVHWPGRKGASLANAQNATGAEARLIHYEVAGRIKASNLTRMHLWEPRND